MSRDPIINIIGARREEKEDRTSHFGKNPVNGGRPPKDIRAKVNRRRKKGVFGRDRINFVEVVWEMWASHIIGMEMIM